MLTVGREDEIQEEAEEEAVFYGMGEISYPGNQVALPLTLGETQGGTTQAACPSRVGVFTLEVLEPLPYCVGDQESSVCSEWEKLGAMRWPLESILRGPVRVPGDRRGPRSSYAVARSWICRRMFCLEQAAPSSQSR
jgi:hypothetical protein